MRRSHKYLVGNDNDEDCVWGTDRFYTIERGDRYTDPFTLKEARKFQKESPSDGTQIYELVKVKPKKDKPKTKFPAGG